MEVESISIFKRTEKISTVSYFERKKMPWFPNFDKHKSTVFNQCPGVLQRNDQDKPAVTTEWH